MCVYARDEISPGAHGPGIFRCWIENLGKLDDEGLVIQGGRIVRNYAGVRYFDWFYDGNCCSFDWIRVIGELCVSANCSGEVSSTRIERHAKRSPYRC